MDRDDMAAALTGHQTHFTNPTIYTTQGQCTCGYTTEEADNPAVAGGALVRHMLDVARGETT